MIETIGDLPNIFPLQNIKGTQNYLPFQKRNWEKIYIHTELCMTKDITYMYIHIKPGCIKS